MEGIYWRIVCEWSGTHEAQEKIGGQPIIKGEVERSINS